MRFLLKKYRLIIVLSIGLVGVVFGYQQIFQDSLDKLRLYKGNGIVQITNSQIATKYPGRVEEILVREGDFVQKGDILAVMQVSDLKAQLLEAEAFFEQAESSVKIAQAQLIARESEKNVAEAIVKQQKSELIAAKSRLERVQKLVRRGAISKQDLDDQTAIADSLESAVVSAEAKVFAAQAAIDIARTEIIGSESKVKAARASITRIQLEIADANLKAPVDGRIQYRVANIGEVVPAGGTVLSMIDIDDIYMTFFIPEKYHTLVSMGDEVRIILDAMSDRVISGSLFFVSPSAQFTPKYVETKNEREKMMFRVKVRFDEQFVNEFKNILKVGIRGVIWVNSDQLEPWPSTLDIQTI